MANELCKPCWRWQSFKNECHFHWDGKKECSRYMEHELDVERYKAIIYSVYDF